MSDRVHVKRNFNANVTKRMRYNYDEFRVDIYQFDKSQEVNFTTPSSSKNAVKINSSQYPLYQAKDILSPMELTFDIHPQKAGTYRLELLYMNTHTTSQNYTKSVNKSVNKADYVKLARSFSSYCSSKHIVPQQIDGYDFRALIYGFATALSSASLPAKVTFTNNKFTKPIIYQNNLNSNSSVKRTDILKVAKSLKGNIDKNGEAPNQIKVGNVIVSISQFTYLMSRAITGTATSFSVINVLNGSCYMNDNANFKIMVDGETVKNNQIVRGLDIIHSRNYAYINISQKQVDKYKSVDKPPLQIKYIFTTANTGYFALAVKKYNLYQADKYNEDGHELTVKSADIQLTNKFDVDSATVNLMYWHGLDDTTNTNLSGYLFDYRDEINIFIKNNAGILEQVFGGYVSTVNVDDNLQTMSLVCANRLIDLDHRNSLSEIYMNSVTDVSEYREKYDYTKNCNNWSSPLKYLCDYAEIPLNTNVSDSKPLVRNKILEQIKYGSNKDKTSAITANHMSYDVNPYNIMLRNGTESNKTQSVRIFDDEVMGLKDKIIINDYPNLWIDYGLGEAESTIKGTTITTKASTTTPGSSTPCPNRGNTATYSTAIYKLANNATNLCYDASDNEHNKKMAKQIVLYVKKKYPYKFYYNSRYSANYLAKHVGHGANCVDKAKLVLTLCSAKGIPHKYLWYRNNSTNGKYTHVLCDIYGVVADAAAPSGGWGHPIKGYSRGSKYAQFPKAWSD